MFAASSPKIRSAAAKPAAITRTAPTDRLVLKRDTLDVKKAHCPLPHKWNSGPKTARRAVGFNHQKHERHDDNAACRKTVKAVRQVDCV